MSDNIFRQSRLNPFDDQNRHNPSFSVTPPGDEVERELEEPEPQRSSFARPARRSHQQERPVSTLTDHIEELDDQDDEEEEEYFDEGREEYPDDHLAPQAYPSQRGESFSVPGRNANPMPAGRTPVVTNRTPSIVGSFAGSYMSGISGVSGASGMSNGRAAHRNYAQSTRSGRTLGQRSFMSTKTATNRKAFVSTRLKGEVYKPWLEKPDPAQRWARWIIIGSFVLGLGCAGLLCWDGYRGVPNPGKLCLVVEDNFDTLDSNVWQREVQFGGWENGEFEWATNSDKNSFVEDNTLYIVPTLTQDVIGSENLLNGYTLNLTSDGSCTAANVTGPNCIITSNSSQGIIIPPVQSARLTTKLSHNIRYGKVEFQAKMPTGDWIWPSIWMLPTENYYGAWPISGEIDIITGRGNDASYASQGVNFITAALHWGPLKALDRTYWTFGWNEQRRRYYNNGFRTFGMEWTDTYMMTYIDSRVNQVFNINYKKKSFWDRGDFPAVVQNGSEQITLTNPWTKSENNSAPFDRPFYLIMDVAVGGTNGWFPDGVGNKPWVDSSPTAPFDFYNATDKWYKTWPDEPKERGMAIKNFKMWQKC